MSRVPITPKRRFEVLKRDNFRCTYCGRSAESGATLEVDHRVPVILGGSNEIDNLATACMECNRGKGAAPLYAQQDDRLRQGNRYEEFAKRGLLIALFLSIFMFKAGLHEKAYIGIPMAIILLILVIMMGIGDSKAG